MREDCDLERSLVCTPSTYVYTYATVKAAANGASVSASNTARESRDFNYSRFYNFVFLRSIAPLAKNFESRNGPARHNPPGNEAQETTAKPRNVLSSHRSTKQRASQVLLSHPREPHACTPSRLACATCSSPLTLLSQRAVHKTVLR